jgi:hypothetical protein
MPRPGPPANPIRYDSVTVDPDVRCAQCAKTITASGRRRFCSDACRQAAYRQRVAAPVPPPNRARPERTVYECSSCEQRYLGVRRCDECNKFCRRIGPGALCPSCDEPVAHVDLEP